MLTSNDTSFWSSAKLIEIPSVLLMFCRDFFPIQFYLIDLNFFVFACKWIFFGAKFKFNRDWWRFLNNFSVWCLISLINMVENWDLSWDARKKPNCVISSALQDMTRIILTFHFYLLLVSVTLQHPHSLSMTNSSTQEHLRTPINCLP